jgi:hypothetical protein
VRLRVTSLLALTAVVAGCGGGGHATPKPSAPATPVARALAPVLDGPLARAGLTYSDEAALRRLAHAPSSVAQLGTTQLDQRWFGLVGFGASTFVASAPQLPRLTGIDLFAADRAVTVGRPPHAVTRLDGRRLDTGAVAVALRRLGARASAGLLALGGEGAVHATGALGQVGIVSALDRVAIRPGTIAAGAYSADVRAVLGGGRSIVADPEWKDAVACLGDVVAARIAPSGGRLLALGVVRPAPHPRAVTERVCVIDATPPVAQLRRTRGVARVTARGQQATVTLDPSEPAGLLFKMNESGALG